MPLPLWATSEWERDSVKASEDEERVLFVDEVLTEIKGQAALVAMDVTGSVIRQQLLPLTSPGLKRAHRRRSQPPQKEIQRQKGRIREYWRPRFCHCVTWCKGQECHHSADICHFGGN
ncbi:uncharacterized protein LOC118965558 isoform X3 [Oncorhynchus mykiss]|uniref:uncharacterized protein LOC118965558 isoform X3 n=1 Tax=Oncorhynchus mykiss TaxID=8022 RepID=UPI0018782740|nr:uncharacterized protein LOC118965558 isoform X3 [Oncorhynchus mykiss]